MLDLHPDLHLAFVIRRLQSMIKLDYHVKRKRFKRMCCIASLLKARHCPYNRGEVFKTKGSTVKKKIFSKSPLSPHSSCLP